MKRTLAVLAAAAVTVAVTAWPASAKGEGPVGATITGPGLGGSGGPGAPGGPGPGRPGGSDEGSGGSGDTGRTAVGTIELRDRSFEGFQNSPLWRLATFSGAADTGGVSTGYIDTSPPKDRAPLGPVYRVTYYEGQVGHRTTAHQLMYPFAPGGPWAYTAPGGNVWFVNATGGWRHTEGRMGLLFLRLLNDVGVPKQNPVPVAAADEVGGASRNGSAPWRLPVAIAAMIALLALGAVAARPRSRARPA